MLMCFNSTMQNDSRTTLHKHEQEINGRKQEVIEAGNNQRFGMQ